MVERGPFSGPRHPRVRSPAPMAPPTARQQPAAAQQARMRGGAGMPDRKSPRVGITNLKMGELVNQLLNWNPATSSCMTLNGHDLPFGRLAITNQATQHRVVRLDVQDFRGIDAGDRQDLNVLIDGDLLYASATPAAFVGLNIDDFCLDTECQIFAAFDVSLRCRASSQPRRRYSAMAVW